MCVCSMYSCDLVCFVDVNSKKFGTMKKFGTLNIGTITGKSRDQVVETKERDML